MKRLLIALALLMVATAAYAACTTQTYMINGKFVVCTVCCDYSGNCTTHCL